MLPIYLLGDSIFDNREYAKMPVLFYLQLEMDSLGGGFDKPKCFAVDGAVTMDVYAQLRKLPKQECHLILSVGGNDALQMAEHLLSAEVSSVHEALCHISETLHEWEKNYRRLVVDIVNRRGKLTLCTIYDNIPNIGQAEHKGIAMFNDVIISTAVDFGVNLIDLRRVCHMREDFSSISPIEPSDVGGQKIAKAIMRANGFGQCGGFTTRHTKIFSSDQ